MKFTLRELIAGMTAIAAMVFCFASYSGLTDRSRQDIVSLKAEMTTRFDSLSAKIEPVSIQAERQKAMDERLAEIQRSREAGLARLSAAEFTLRDVVSEQHSQRTALEEIKKASAPIPGTGRR